MFNDLDQDKPRLQEAIEAIKAHIEKQETKSAHQELCLQLVEQYGLCDIGIIFTFFFNILKMKIGDSFVISPDEPHAYISGELMEAMVNSDNVVRGGLTPKLKDTKTLQEVSQIKMIITFSDA